MLDEGSTQRNQLSFTATIWYRNERAYAPRETKYSRKVASLVRYLGVQLELSQSLLILLTRLQQTTPPQRIVQLRIGPLTLGVQVRTHGSAE